MIVNKGTKGHTHRTRHDGSLHQSIVITLADVRLVGKNQKYVLTGNRSLSATTVLSNVTFLTSMQLSGN